VKSKPAAALALHREACKLKSQQTTQSPPPITKNANTIDKKSAPPAGTGTANRIYITAANSAYQKTWPTLPW